ncbi:MAG: FAD-dependent oxidoreductase [Candidatus Cloacimonas sp.]|nr:FAD-dependent oxidoreductase [Candidatus Cloacimonadota bacterium]
MKRYVIVGGVAGGASVAARLRRMDESSEIVMIERGKYISYANCGLPYYIGGTISERDNLFVQTVEEFSKRFKIDVRVQNEVIGVDTEKKQVKIRNLVKDEEYDLDYHKLVLSPGAKPLTPPIVGIDLEGIFTLRNVEDTDRIKEYLDKNKPESAIVIGAGYIGIEMAENLKEICHTVSIVEMADRVLPFFDYDMSSALRQHMNAQGVDVYLKERVVSIERKDGKLIALLDSGKRVSGDILILSAGVRPDTGFLQGSGIDLSQNGSIIVDEYLKTTAPDVYALGDAIQAKYILSDDIRNAYLAGPANKQGRILADNLVFGDKIPFKGVLGTVIIKVFELTAGIVGMSEDNLKSKGRKYIASTIHSSSNAGYYPGALPITIKLMFSPDDGKILGAQVIGYVGVDKRLDVIAAMIQSGSTVYDMTEFEQAYAPPYSSARDPVNVAGYVAENILTKKVNIVTLADLDSDKFRGAFLIDNRTAEEFELGSIPGGINIPLDELRDRLDEIPKDKDVIIYCRVGQRGYLGARILMQSGFQNVYNLSGGYMSYDMVYGKADQSDIYAGEIISSDDQMYPDESYYSDKMEEGEKIALDINACGLQCPGPIIRLKESMDQLADNSILQITASDPGFANDLKAWCNMTGNKLLSIKKEGSNYVALVRKASKMQRAVGRAEERDNKTLIVFSDDLDKALASFVIANGAASTGKKVTMFFTFWGLNVIKRSVKEETKRDFMGTMFNKMLASDSGSLSLSKLNMMGMGPKMMRQRMKDKKIDSLEEMIDVAIKSGVQMIACQMSMDVMGVVKSDLIDGVAVGGVATYLEEAEKSNLNLFI